MVQIQMIRYKRIVDRLSLLLAVCMIGTTSMMAQSTTELLRREIDKLTMYETTIDTAVVPGYLVGIIDGQNQAILSFGRRSLTSQDTLTRQDVFELGSVSKVITSTLCANLDANGTIIMTEAIDESLPAEFQNSNGYTVSIEQLL